MVFHFRHALKAWILLALSGLLFKLHYTGEIGKLINLKYSFYTQVASVGLIFLFYVQTGRIWIDRREQQEEACGPDCSHDDGKEARGPVRTAAGYLILLLPLATGFLLPPQTLDAAAAAKKGLVNLSGPQVQSQATLELMKEQKNEQSRLEKLYSEELVKLQAMDAIVMDEQNYATYIDVLSTFPDRFQGKRIQLSGFVYKEDGMASNRLVVSRFLVTHCVADAAVIGLLAETDEAPKLTPDTWLKAEGILEIGDYEGARMPLIRVTGWSKIQPPDDPYLYPEMKLLVSP